MSKRSQREKELTDKAIKWICSEEGQKMLERVSKETQELIEYRRERRRIDSKFIKIINEPITL
jgi:ABC-type Fe3+ transport system substrate-binding protein